MGLDLRAHVIFYIQLPRNVSNTLFNLFGESLTGSQSLHVAPLKRCS